MLKSSIYTLLIILFTTPFLISAQTREITESEFWAQYRSGDEKASAVPRRIVKTESLYVDGKLSKVRKEILEYSSADTQHVIETETLKGQTKTNEMIQFRDVYYCRSGKGQWRKATDRCLDLRLSGGTPSANSQFSQLQVSRDGKTLTAYQQKGTYYSPPTGKSYLRKYEDEFVINDEGLIIGRKTKLITEELKAEFVTDEKYEYRPSGLRIEAPIK